MFADVLSPMPKPMLLTLSAYPDMSDLLAFWQRQALAAERSMPRRSDLDTLALKPWLGHLSLLDVLGAGRYRYRVYGTKMAELLQNDFHGQDISGLPEPHRSEAQSDYGRVVESRASFFIERERMVRRPIDFEWQRRTIGKLILPLSEDGDKVTQILAAVYPKSKPSK